MPDDDAQTISPAEILRLLAEMPSTDELIADLLPGYSSDFLSDEWFIRRESDSSPLEIRDAPCSDCAVLYGMYAPFSAALSRCSPSTQAFVSVRWWCHSGGGACRGNIEYLAAAKSKG